MIEKGPTSEMNEYGSSEIEEVWHLNYANLIHYSLVKIPIETPIYIAYNNPLANEDITIYALKNNDIWQLQGRINPRSFYYLNLFANHDVDDQQQIDYSQYRSLEKFGDIAQYDDNTFLVNLALYASRVRYFLNAIWGGNNISLLKPEYIEIVTGDYENKQFRILPQQVPTEKSDGQDAAIIVNKYSLS